MNANKIDAAIRFSERLEYAGDRTTAPKGLPPATGSAKLTGSLFIAGLFIGVGASILLFY